MKPDLTCLPSVTYGRSFAVAVQGNHSDIVVSAGEQLLQESCGGGSWDYNLRRKNTNMYFYILPLLGSNNLLWEFPCLSQHQTSVMHEFIFTHTTI